jgi:hypothetical protein
MNLYRTLNFYLLEKESSRSILISNLFPRASPGNTFLQKYQSLSQVSFLIERSIEKVVIVFLTHCKEKSRNCRYLPRFWKFNQRTLALALLSALNIFAMLPGHPPLGILISIMCRPV